MVMTSGYPTLRSARLAETGSLTLEALTPPLSAGRTDGGLRKARR
jgi:hypothetical protein